MSDQTMWFGNRNYMQWIPCPQVGAAYGSIGSGNGGQYLHGGSFRRQTLNTTKGRSLTWSLNARDAIRPITDYVEGVYGRGAIYWLDPFDMDKNVLAQSFATPSLGGYDGIVLNGGDLRPQLVVTTPNPYGYPAESAVYTLNAATDKPYRHWVPIPPGYTAWVGANGVAGTGGTVYARTTNGPVAAGALCDICDARQRQLPLVLHGERHRGVDRWNRNRHAQWSHRSGPAHRNRPPGRRLHQRPGPLGHVLRWLPREGGVFRSAGPCRPLG